MKYPAGEGNDSCKLFSSPW